MEKTGVARDRKTLKAQDCCVTVAVDVYLRCDLQQVLGLHFTPFVKWG